MLKISDFSRLTQIPAKTLRYYDEIDLFKPASVDRFTGYRYYSVEQLPRLNRILALKNLGLALNQIAQLLDDDLTPEQIRGMLRLKRAETLQLLEEEQVRLSFVEAKLKQIEMEGQMSRYEVVIKKIEPVRVASVRDQIPDLSQIGAAFGRMMGLLGGHIAQHNGNIAGPPVALYYNLEMKEKDIDFEVGFPISDDLPETEQVKMQTIPTVETMACAVHVGPYSEFDQAYTAIMEWIETNGYQVGGPNREVYLQHDENNPAGNVTEIQFPVAKA